MDEMIAWLLAQVDWLASGGSPDQHEKMCGYDQIEFEAECDCEVPARVLREVEAKRRIIEGCERILCLEHPEGYEADILAESTLRLLALPFSDRPGYQESWRP